MSVAKGAVSSLKDLSPEMTMGVTLSLGALRHNYGVFQKEAKKVAGVVKADAYGLGLIPVSKALYEAGCRDFFVAFVEEGIALRASFPESSIYVIAGVLPGTESLFEIHNLIPVLISLSQVERWSVFGKNKGKRVPALLHLDTGMNRTGLIEADLPLDPSLLEFLDILYVMTHFASAEDTESSQNVTQRVLFDRMCGHFPSLPTSLANSAAVFLGDAYQGDLVRPGIGMLGLQGSHELRSAVTLSARIVQVKEVPQGQRVGYNGIFTTKKKSRLATLGMGYADGLLRASAPKARVKIGSFTAPFAGRISMDFSVIDVTDIPEEYAQEGDWVDLFWDRESAWKLSQAAGTIPYEILVNLGKRYGRVIKEDLE